MKLLTILRDDAVKRCWTGVFIQALQELGEFEMVRNGDELSEEQRVALIRDCDVLLTAWDSIPIPLQIVENPGNLKYVCNVTGTIRQWVPLELIESGLPVTNWGDAPSVGIAEGAMALLLSTLKDIHEQVERVEAGGWGAIEGFYGGTLYKLHVGIYGMGVIGRRFVELIRPFDPILHVYDPYVTELPEDCIREETLADLCRHSETLVVHAGLSEETRGSITAELLALLPDHASVVNTARGAIFDQQALFAELESGRLRAGLDVLEPDLLPVDHPARKWPNVIFTAHHISRTHPTYGQEPTRLERYQEVCLENLRRFQAGELLQFVFDRERYLRST